MAKLDICITRVHCYKFLVKEQNSGALQQTGKKKGVKVTKSACCSVTRPKTRRRKKIKSTLKKRRKKKKKSK